jgi:(2R)-3-sulfolactate dehydrogenase (NADP+)
MTDRVLTVMEALDWVADTFEQRGASAATARSIAAALVGAEVDGLKGHGLTRIPSYLAMLKTGKANGTVVPVAKRTAPGVLVIDAGDGFAYPAVDLALAELPAIARAQGIATAAIHRSNHCGAAGLHVEKLARQGLVALFFANAPASIAPWGGRQAVFGTNPIAFAAPLDEGRDPVVVDLSVSKVARGNLLAARNKGQPIPEGWALDPDGNPTTDTEKGLAGTMVPMGEAKGAALALMVEVLSACLTGANLATQSTSFFDGAGDPPGTGQLILAIDPAAFGHARFGALLTLLVGQIEGQEGTRLPGARRYQLRARAAEAGVTVPADLEAQIAKA